MLCLKKKKFWGSSSSYGPQSQSKNYGLDQGNGHSSDEPSRRGGSRDTSRAKDMAPPPAATQAIHPVVREVTEDTPPDLLEGTMDLLVILPSGKTVQTTVDRKTPMMDLLIHVATANKINPAGHIVQVRNERGIEMPYKPSTPIGALDTTTIEIVPKNRVNEYIIVKKPAKVANQPFETTFRLQVHLPRNQLYVMRISPKTLLEEILREVCQEKNLDISRYEIRHPVNLDQKLPLSACVGETGLQELTVVSKNSKINSSVSTADIMALQQSDECRGKGCLDGSFKHSRSSVGDSSVSSESTGSGRGISPCRSEDSRSISPLPLIRPKTLLHSRISNVSTCSSSGNSSGLVHNKTNTLESSVTTSQVSHQQVVMQAPPRTKKRAAPLPPTRSASTPVGTVNSLNGGSTVTSPISEKNEISCTPISANNGISGNELRASAAVGTRPLERPVPRKKGAPAPEPPKPHPPLSHHQSLPLNHSRHNSGSIDPHQDVPPSFGQHEQNELRQLDRANQSAIRNMSRGHSISSSMTNLTSVSSVSSTSLASSTGGLPKKRRAPKPPALATLLKHPTQIEEETTTTDSEAGGVGGTLHATRTDASGNSELNIKQQQPTTSQDHIQEEEELSVDQEERWNENRSSAVPVVAVGKEGRLPDNSLESEVLSRSPVSSLSSVSNSRSESTTSSPIPPSSLSATATTEYRFKSNADSSSSRMMKGKDRSLNTNEALSTIEGERKLMAGAGVRDDYDENESPGDGTRYSSSPSSSSNNNDNNNVIAAATSSPSPPDSVRSGNLSSSIAVDEAQSVVVEETATPSSSRPPSSSNTQVSSSTTRAMPLPLPRRRAPTAPPQNASSTQGQLQATKVESSSGAGGIPSSSFDSRAEEKQEMLNESSHPKPKPRPRPDRKSVESLISNTSSVIKPHYRPNEMKSSSNAPPEAGIASNTNTYASVQMNQLKNPLAKYGVKVLPDNVLKERAERLKAMSESSDSIISSSPPPPPATQGSNAFEDDAKKPQSSHSKKSTTTSTTTPTTPAKVPIQAKKSTSSCDSAIDDYSDSGSITSLSKSHGRNSVASSSTGNTGFSSRPAPSLSKSDYTSQGSVRSLKQLTSNSTKSSSPSANAVVESANNDLEDEYDSDNLEENLDFFEPAAGTTAPHKIGESSLTKSVSPQRNPAPIPTPIAPVAKDKKASTEMKSTRPIAPGKSRVYSSVSAYEDVGMGDDSSRSPSALSDSGFTRTASQKDRKMIRGKHDNDDMEKEEDDDEKNVKLNRWQNMVSLNEIENAKEASTNKPLVNRSSSKQSNTNSGDLLHGDYQHTKISLSEAGDECQNDATCHSSESEASYTDSGVPATETVTPSPVNMDDVILDHEFHATAQPEKLSSEDDSYEHKHSSRRSSLQSDHSEEWMNILEAKMNKDEEAIEKMFEAVLPPAGDEIENFAGENEKVIERKTEQDPDESKKNEEITSSDKNSKIKVTEEQDGREHEMIETTVELHHIPSTSTTANETKSSEMTAEEEDMLAEIASTTTAPVRKLSKSESFSHNSEFNEAKQRRKNFHSARSNAMVQRSSQGSGSVTDLRHSCSGSEDEQEELGPLENSKEKFNNANSMQQQRNRIRDDRTVSMNDLSSAAGYGVHMAESNNLQGDAKMNDNDMSAAATEEKTATVHKATSLQQLPDDENREEAVNMEMYRKQLEMQFEQWKEEFMKKVIVSPSTETQEKSSAADKTVVPSEKEAKPQNQKAPEVLATKTECADEGIELESKPEDLKVGDDAPTAAAKSVSELKERFVDRTEKASSEGETSVSKDTIDTSEAPSQQQEENSVEEMKNIEEYPPVELRKKEPKKESPSVVYQYAGPPTIKMASWNERPRRAVSVKKDEDYIMGMGQQDANAKTPNPTRIHSFHGGPIVPLTSTTANAPENGVAPLKTKTEASPNPTVSTAKGWSAVINAPSLVQNSNGSVRSVLSTWKQKMEETEKEKSKPKPRDGPPAEIDIYGGAERQQDDVPSKNSRNLKTIENSDTPKNVVPVRSATFRNETPVKPVVSEQNAINSAKVSPNVQEKAKTLGSSFRSEAKPVVFTISPMESNTLPRNNKPKPVSAKSVDVVDSKPKQTPSAIEIDSSSGSLEERKKFFQGIKPVENGKEAPIPAANLKSNIAAIQKVFEKQRMTKIQQMGSQQSLYSDGTVSPVPSLQRNDSLESRQSTLKRQNSFESHSSDSSSVVLRVSQNSSGKSSPQMSSTEMVQKLLGRPNSYNVELSRRTPSPISSTTSTLSSPSPSPTVIDGPNNSVRISTGPYKPPTQPSNIRSVGNKAIIIVNGEDNSKELTKRNTFSANDNLILEEPSKAKRSSAMSAYVSAISQQQGKREAVPPPPPSTKNSVLKKIPSESAVMQKNNARNTQTNGPASNGVPPPPPPPPADGAVIKKQLSLDIKNLSSPKGGSNVRSSKGSTPTSPMSPDPRAEIFNAIKNSNGNFGLRKTGSTILLK